MDLTQSDLVIGSFQLTNANFNFGACHMGVMDSSFRRWKGSVGLATTTLEIGTYLYGGLKIVVDFSYSFILS